MNDFGIGILDVFSQTDLNNCLESIPPSLREDCFVVLSQNNKSLKEFKNKKYSEDSSISSLRNKLIAHFRVLNKKYIFLIKSNVIIKNPSFFEELIKKASLFGTWVITGYDSNSFLIEDEEINSNISVSIKYNDDVVFLLSGIIKQTGYLNENYMDDSGLDILELINKCRKLKLTPSHPFFVSTNKEDLEFVKTKRPDNKNQERLKQISFGAFQYYNKYIPGYNDPFPSSKEELMITLKNLQENYAKKL